MTNLGKPSGSELELPELLWLIPELRRTARKLMAEQAPGHTLQPTALINEAWHKLRDKSGWESKAHFTAVVTLAMKQILIDHAKAKQRLKRRPPGEREPLEGLTLAGEQMPAGVADLMQALEYYETLNPFRAEVIRLAHLGGMSQPEIARYKGVSLRTIEREIKQARTWLRVALSAEGR